MATDPMILMPTRRVFAWIALFAATCWLPAAGRAETVEEFYRGKQVVLLVASGAALIEPTARNEK
ncbi:MAG TPA: hypothetical protein VGP86_03360 [Xanthobacteraceae bacterium]|nr:hypothetical protein [Xanthobacteraceae bacterium]